VKQEEFSQRAKEAIDALVNEINQPNVEEDVREILERIAANASHWWYA
jgi:hypothetical protein